MRVAITGGTGFVGGHLARALSAEGHEVVLVARGLDVRDKHVRELAGARVVEASVTDEESLLLAFEGCDAVAHCAGINREIGSQTFRAVHVGGTRAVVGAARRAGVGKVVLLSYLRARPGTGTPYLESKWQAEQIVEGSGLSYLIVKAGVIFGKGDHLVDHTAKALGTLHLFTTVGIRDRRTRPVAVQDIVRLIRCSIVDGRLTNRVVSVPGSEEMRFGELARRVARVIGVRAFIVPAPIWFLYLVALAGELTMKIPLVSRAQVRLLDEGNLALTSSLEPPADLRPSIQFDDASIRAALPEHPRFRWEDFRWSRRAL